MRTANPNSGELRKMLEQLWRDEEGLTTVEYALLLALIALTAIIAWTTLGMRTSNTVTVANSSLPGS
jgi:Flp pilus assembly pilin Flp